jgi:hypothetical protein
VATHDCNDAFDPSFFDPVLVNRLDETVDSAGRVQTVTTQISTVAVVLATSPNDLQRLPEEEYMLKSISLYSPFRFQGPAEDPVSGARQKPDHVIWHGSTYVVRLLDDYTPYGRGFTHAVAVSVDAVDPAPYAAVVH